MKEYEDIRRCGEANELYQYIYEEVKKYEYKLISKWFDIDKNLAEKLLYYYKYNKVRIENDDTISDEDFFNFSKKVIDVENLSTYIFLAIISSFDNIQTIDISNTYLSDEHVYEIINIFRKITYEFGLRLRETDKLKYMVYWVKYHSYEYRAVDYGIKRMELLIKYKGNKELVDEKIMRYFR